MKRLTEISNSYLHYEKAQDQTRLSLVRLLGRMVLGQAEESFVYLSVSYAGYQNLERVVQV
jgi:hypothetical protein